MREQPQAPSLRIAAPAPRASRHGSAQGSGRPRRWAKRSPKKTRGKKIGLYKKGSSVKPVLVEQPGGVSGNPSRPHYCQSTQPAACPLREQPAPPARAAPAAAVPAPARPCAERPARPAASPARPPIGPARPVGRGPRVRVPLRTGRPRGLRLSRSRSTGQKLNCMFSIRRRELSYSGDIRRSGRSSAVSGDKRLPEPPDTELRAVSKAAAWGVQPAAAVRLLIHPLPQMPDDRQDCESGLYKTRGFKVIQFAH